MDTVMRGEGGISSNSSGPVDPPLAGSSMRRCAVV